MSKTKLIIVGVLGGMLLGVAVVLPRVKVFFPSLFDSEVMLLALLFIAFFMAIGGLLANEILIRVELREKDEKLRNALESNLTKDEFISLVLHHLRTPLSGMKWLLYEILEDHKGETSKLHKMLRRLYEENETVLRAVKHLIEAARASVERMEYSFENVTLEDIRSISEKAIEDMSSRFKQAGISFEISLPSAPEGIVRVDTSKIRTVLQSFIENSIDYTLKGGKVGISIKYNKNSVEIAVSDTGIGISKENLQKICLQFFRAENARRIKPEGFGVGMFLAKKFIEHQGGTILLESEIGKGTVATIVLPIYYAVTGKVTSDTMKN